MTTKTIKYRPIKYFMLLNIICLFLLGAFFTTASAQNLITTPPTTAEDIGFTFYKMANAAPDYETIIKANPDYKNTPPESQAAFLEQQKLQMQLRFTNYNPENKLITIRSAIYIDAKVGVPAGLNIAFKKKEITTPNNDPIFFPYPFGPQMVAVIANGIENYKYIRLSPIEASNAARKIDGNTATMVVQILPKYVDAQRPFMSSDNMPVWLMMGDIAQIIFFNDNAETIWSYQADWYKPTDDYRLMQLYKE